MSAVINIALFVLLGIFFILYAKRHWKERYFIWQVWRGFRPLMLIETLLLLTVTIAAVVALDAIGKPFTWGWYELLIGHSGNAGIQPIVDAGQSAHWFWQAVAMAVLVLLLLIMPFFTRAEEVGFRKGRETWRRSVPASLKFGLWHMWVGVPLSVGLALTIPGLFLAWKYKRAFGRSLTGDDPEVVERAREAGVLRSTTYHTLHNSFILLVIFHVMFK